MSRTKAPAAGSRAPRGRSGPPTPAKAAWRPLSSRRPAPSAAAPERVRVSSGCRKTASRSVSIVLAANLAAKAGGYPSPVARLGLCSGLMLIFWLAGEGSNLQPPDPKSGVLPVELPAKWLNCACRRSSGPTAEASARPGPMVRNDPRGHSRSVAVLTLCADALTSGPAWDRSSKSAASGCGRRSIRRC